MANNAGLKITISADLTNTVQAFNQASQSAEEFGINIGQSVSVAGASADQLSQSLSPLAGVFTSVANSSEQLNKVAGNLAAAGQGAKQLGSSISQSLVTAYTSVDGMSAAVTKLKTDLSAGIVPKIELTAFNQASQAAENVGISVKQSLATAVTAATGFAAALAPVSNVFNQVANSSVVLGGLSGNINAAAGAAAKATTSLQQLGRAPLKDIASLQKGVANLKRDLATGFKPIFTQTNPIIPASAPAAIKGFSQSVGSIKNASAPAIQSVTDLSRLLSDLPYGFNGVANNIGPFIEGLKRTAQSAGGVVPAIRAIAGSLIGAGGLIFAANALPAIFLIATQGIMNFGRKSKDAESEVDKLAKTLAEVSNNAKNVEFTAFGDVSGDIAKVEALARAVRDESKSQAERKRALEDLKDVNKAYFGDLTLQEGQLQKLTSRVNEYTDALVKESIIKELSGEIGKLGAQYLKQVKNVRDAETALRTYEEQLNNTRAEISKGKANTFVLLDPNSEVALQGLKNALKEQQTALTPLEAQYNSLRNSVGEYIDETLKIRDLKTTPVASAKEDTILKDLKESLSGYQKQLEVTNKLREAGVLPIYRENDALETQLRILETLNAIDAREVLTKVKPKLEIDAELNALEIQTALNTASARLGSIPMPITVLPQLKIDVAAVTLPPGGVIADDAFDEVIDQMETAGASAAEKAKTVGLDISAAISGAMGGAAEAIGSGLGDILSGLGAGGLVAGFANVLSDLLTQLGKMLIQTGVKILALQELVLKIAATPAGAAAAIVGGIAAIALGKILQNSVRNITPRRFEYGGLVTRPTMGIIGEAGPEAVIPLDKLGGMIGTGGANVQIVGNLEMDMRRFYLNFQRVAEANGRVNR